MKTYNNTNCPICYERLSGASLLPCGHRMHSECLFRFWQTKYTELCPCPICRHPIKDTNIINLVQMDILQNRVVGSSKNDIENIIDIYYDFRWKESNREADSSPANNIPEAEPELGLETRFIRFFNKYLSPIVSLFLLYFLIGLLVLGTIEIIKYIGDIRPLYVYNYIRFSLSMLKYKFLNIDIIRFAIYTFRQV